MSFKDLLAAGADGAIAIAAPGRAPLDYAALRTLVDRTLASLNALGVGRNDRVAIVLANGPEMATCYLACAAGTTSAPLNPGYRADEFEFYLSDLNAKVLIVEQASTSPAIEVARKLGVRIVDLVADAGAAAVTFGWSRAKLARRTRQRWAATQSRATSAWCCTPRAPRRGPRSCPCRWPTSAPPRPTSAARCSSPRRISA